MRPESLIAETFNVDFNKGINESELEERRRRFGTNIKEAKKPQGYFSLLWAAMEDFTLRILLAASAFSIILNVSTDTDNRDIAWIEGFAIFMAVAISSNVQVLNDMKKERLFGDLSAKVESRKLLTVIRNGGEEKEITGPQLVAGDIVLISEGSDIPADGYVLEAHDLSADESAMTGEPDPIKKEILPECLRIKQEIEDEGRANTAGAHEVPSPVLLAGTQIASGSGKYVVMVVGKDSTVGRIQDILDQETDATPLQQKLEKIAGDIGKFGLISAIFVMVILFIRFLADRGRLHDWSDGSQYTQLLDYFIIAIAIIVVAIPEGLPLAVALSLAYSVGRMLKDQNLVRRLQACETMGGANMICSDKTGTLTQNKMDLSSFWSRNLTEVDAYRGNQEISTYIKQTRCQDLFIQACTCNTTASLESQKGSKTDIALLKFAANMGVDGKAYKNKHVSGTSVIYPFSSKRKRMSTILENVKTETLSNKRMHLKGASEYVLEACSQIHFLDTDEIVTLNADIKADINAAINSMASSALRTIGIAYKDIVGGEDLYTVDSSDVHSVEKEGFTLIAILGIKDLLRKEVIKAVQDCKTAKIKVRMVTGDNKITAKAIARECGIYNPSEDHEDSVLEGVEFNNRVGGVVCNTCKTKVCDCPRDKKTAAKRKKPMREDVIQNKQEFQKIVQHLDVLARSRPEDKYTLVTGLKELGNVVAVTGDGTNDAPALKKADVGFAMGISGTEVARETADIILLDDNFNSIVSAVMWGRNIYDSIRKFLQFQLTVNVVAVFLTLFGSGLYRMAILTTVQLLWVNLIMDTLAALALATESPDPQLLKRAPHDKDEYMLSRKMIKFIICHSIYQLLVTLLITCIGDQFIPEDPGSSGTWTLSNGTSISRFSPYGYVRSGRLYTLTGDNDYEPYADDLGGSRHMTVVFDTFVIMQVFNFVNARQLEDRFNIFHRLHKSPMFIAIVVLILGLQILLGMVGNRPLNVNREGTTGAQWGIAFAFGFGEWIVGALIKLVPDRIFPRSGKEKQDPVKNPSKVLSVRRSSEYRSNTIRNSTVINPDPKKGSLTTKIATH